MGSSTAGVASQESYAQRDLMVYSAGYLMRPSGLEILLRISMLAMFGSWKL